MKLAVSAPDGNVNAPATTRSPLAQSTAPVHRPSAQRHSLLLHARGLWDAGSTVAPLSPPQHSVAFDKWCRKHPGRSCDLWLANALVHELVCDPALPLATDEALTGHARARFVQRHGDAARTWPLLAWSAQGRQGVSALHGVNLAELGQAARTHRVKLRSVKPWWVRVVAITLRHMPELLSTPQAWLIIVEGGFASALRLHRGALADMQSDRLAEPTSAALQVFAARLQLLTPPGSGAGAPVFAMGHGLTGGPVDGVQPIGLLDGATPLAAWLLPLGAAFGSAPRPPGA